MSETTTTAAAAEPAYGDPVTASDVSMPNALSQEAPADARPEGEAAAENADKPGDKAEPKGDKAGEDKPREDWRELRLRQQNARISAETRRADDAMRRLAALEAAVASRGGQPPAQPGQPQQAAPQAQQPTPQPGTAEFDRIVTERAAAIAQRDAFNTDCARVADAGIKEFPDFATRLGTLWQATDGTNERGELAPHAIALIEAALETDRPAAVLHHLGSNPDEAIKIAALRSDARRGAAVARIAATLATAAATPRPVSRAPAPLDPVPGGARSEAGAQGPRDTAAWMKWRDEQIKARRSGHDRR